MSDTKRPFRMFRNVHTSILYLTPRGGGTDRFAVRPGETIEAVNEKEENLLAAMGYFVDVATEIKPVVAHMNDLKKDLEKAQKENQKLKEENEGLKKKKGGDFRSARSLSSTLE